MQAHDAYPDPSASSPGAHETGAVATPVDSAEAYVHPTIPVGLPHVVQFVEASLHHLPMSVRFVGDRMSRYANAEGVVSIAIPFICQITGLGSKNTVEHHIRLMESMGVLEKRPGKGGKDRRSNTYIFLGDQRNWKPLPTERPGTDPWIALAQARRENEELRAEIDRLKNGGAIGHSGVTDGEESKALEPTSHSYENSDFSTSTEAHGAISHSEVTDGSEETPADENSLSNKGPDSELSSATQEPISHSGMTNGPDEGQEYLSRRARVEKLVLNHRDYYQQSFDRRGVLGAIAYFSRSAENEQELMRQAGILESGGDPRQSGTGPPPETGPQSQTSEDSDRYGVGQCPDCGRPFATHGGATHCTDCTERRRRESEA